MDWLQDAKDRMAKIDVVDDMTWVNRNALIAIADALIAIAEKLVSK